MLTLSTREQHIRRERRPATSAPIPASAPWPSPSISRCWEKKGSTRLARLNHAKASALADRLAALPGVELITDAFFNEFTIKLPKAAAPVVEALAQKGVIAGVPAARLLPHEKGCENLLILAVTETNTDEDFDALIAGADRDAGLMSMNNQGRPSGAGEAFPASIATISGDRGLDHEEALIFELGHGATRRGSARCADRGKPVGRNAPQG